MDPCRVSLKATLTEIGIQNRQSKIQNGGGRPFAGSGANSFAFVGDVIDNDEVSHLIGRGVKNPAGVEP